MFRSPESTLSAKEEINDRTKNELLSIWTDWKSITAGLVVVIPLIIYAMNLLGFFNYEPGTLTTLKGLLWEPAHQVYRIHAGEGRFESVPGGPGPVTFLLIFGYFPVMAVSAGYLIYLILKSITAASRVVYRAGAIRRETKGEPKTVSKEELINILAKGK